MGRTTEAKLKENKGFVLHRVIAIGVYIGIDICEVVHLQ